MAAVDYFLKIDTIPGESQDSKHKNEIQLESFSFGGSQSGSFASGGGGGAGKVQMQDMHFTKYVDKASPKLMLACANGEHIKSAILTVRKAGKDQQEYMKVTISDCLVSSFQTSGASGHNGLCTESFSLNFAKIAFEYKEQKADGTLGGTTKAEYDLKAMKASA